MANTYTQIYLHCIFAVKNRDSLIHKDWKEELYKYMTGIVQNHKLKMLIINGVADHVHMLVRAQPTQSTSDLIENVKGASSKWINDRQFVRDIFMAARFLCIQLCNEERAHDD